MIRKSVGVLVGPVLVILGMVLGFVVQSRFLKCQDTCLA